MSAAAEGGALWLLVAAAMALRPELRTTARNGALAVVVDSIGAHVLAAVVRRERPAGEELPAYQALKRKPRSSSFPSAHTATAAAFLAAVAPVHRTAFLALSPLAVLIAYSRLRTRAHWPTDVLGGAVWGVVVGAALHRAWRRT